MGGRASQTMARPKKKGGPGSEPSAGFAVRGSKEWHTWVTELADHRRLKVTDLIDQALVEYAERHSFTRPAPKR